VSETLAADPGPEAPAAVRLRRLAYADLPAVLAIERRSFQTPWSLAMFVLELSKPSSICVAAATDDGLVGYLVCSRYADVWHLMNIAVEPDRRREGIATQLMDRLFDEAGTDARYTLEVRTSNSVAISMYERFGFRAAGHRRRYYHDNGEDALIMWLERAGAAA
jgi:ribosomal-protein-alanine N-acetyltransferase